MRIALGQINPTVGAIADNTQAIRCAIDRASQQGAQLVVFPELAVLGYPPKDLLLKPAVIDRCVDAIDQLADHCRGIAAIIGYPRPTRSAKGRPLHNAAALCQNGRVTYRYDKSLLPTYDVFDEHRYFEPGTQPGVAQVGGVRVGVSICEDLWNEPGVVDRQLYHGDPIQALTDAGAQLMINCAASPFVVGKHAFRLKLLTAAAKRHRLPAVFCNQVGGNDELVFDGHSCIVDGAGALLAQAKGFEADLLVVDVPIGPTPTRVDTAADTTDTTQAATHRVEPTSDGMKSVHQALVLGLGDYCRKCGFQDAVLGLSGGIDSAVTACVAVAGLGADRVRGVTMPSRYSSPGSVDDAAELAQRLSIRFEVIPIHEPHQALEQALIPHFEQRAPDATEENIQARLRGLILMSLSNKFGSLLVTTGNKSELAVGYCTLYGDMAGGLAVLSDVPKTLVFELARWINDAPDSPLRLRTGGPVIPADTLTKPPSAELRSDQTDQDTLPPYALLDQIIERYVEHEQSTLQILEALPQADPATVKRVIRLIDRNEYKRKQAAPGLKITGRAFGFGRRMPIAQRYTHRG